MLQLDQTVHDVFFRSDHAYVHDLIGKLLMFSLIRVLSVCAYTCLSLSRDSFQTVDSMDNVN